MTVLLSLRLSSPTDLRLLAPPAPLRFSSSVLPAPFGSSILARAATRCRLELAAPRGRARRSRAREGDEHVVAGRRSRRRAWDRSQ